MKKFILSSLFAILSMASVYAQRIAVVSGNGNTQIFQTLAEAIKGAENGSTIYLPGGNFVLAAADNKIDKKLTIVGVSHKINAGDIEGMTQIGGDLSFQPGSDGSVVMGCYLTGAVSVGNSVKNLLIRYCNVGYVGIGKECTGIVVNQNYIRDCISGENSGEGYKTSEVTITNNIVNRLRYLYCSTIANNIILSTSFSNDNAPLYIVHNSIIRNNIFIGGYTSYSNDNECSGNLVGRTDSAFPKSRNTILTDVDWNNVFVNYGGINIDSDFHFKDEYKQYADKGIYGGTGFRDSQQPSVPHIMSASIPEQTDSDGKLHIRIQVRAGE